MDQLTPSKTYRTCASDLWAQGTRGWTCQNAAPPVTVVRAAGATSDIRVASQIQRAFQPHTGRRDRKRALLPAHMRLLRASSWLGRRVHGVRYELCVLRLEPCPLPPPSLPPISAPGHNSRMRVAADLSFSSRFAQTAHSRAARPRSERRSRKRKSVFAAEARIARRRRVICRT